jgi:hypothetical protein
VVSSIDSLLNGSPSGMAGDLLEWVFDSSREGGRDRVPKRGFSRRRPSMEGGLNSLPYLRAVPPSAFRAASRSYWCP